MIEQTAQNGKLFLQSVEIIATREDGRELIFIGEAGGVMHRVHITRTGDRYTFERKVAGETKELRIGLRHSLLTEMATKAVKMFLPLSTEPAAPPIAPPEAVKPAAVGRPEQQWLF